MSIKASADYRLLHEYLGWSQEVARLEQLLTDGTAYSRGELQRALNAVWSLLPPDEPFQSYRAALHRLVDAYIADRIQAR
jgi:hypothetical protein